MGHALTQLLNLQQKLKLAKTLEDNRLMGPRRVEAYHLSRRLEEFAARPRPRP